MKITDCFWERANLNRDVVEIVMWKSDSIADLDFDVLEKKYNYIVIKTETNDAEKYCQLQSFGYVFIELQLSISKRINQFDMNDRLIKRMIK